MHQVAWSWAAAGIAAVVSSWIVFEATDGPSSNGLQQRGHTTQAAGVHRVPPVDAPPVPALQERPEDRHYAGLRAQLRWVESTLAAGALMTLDAPSRMLLAKSAAERAGLQEVGLGFQDVYGIINAETSWVPRTGASKDGTPNLGVAQFEPATAEALGLRDPHDVVEAVHVAAVHMREAAQWSRSRIAGLKLSPKQHAAKLREGVSIYYNLSSRGRAGWNGRNTHTLPVETNRHIQNARLGAREAAELDAQLARVSRLQRGPDVVTAGIGMPGR